MDRQGSMLNPGDQFTDWAFMAHYCGSETGFIYWETCFMLVFDWKLIQRQNVYTVESFLIVCIWVIIFGTLQYMNDYMPVRGLKVLIRDKIPTCTYLQNIFYISNCQIRFGSFGIKLFFYLLLHTIQYFRHTLIKWRILPFPGKKKKAQWSVSSKTINSTS